jgi:hypothetical protein
MSLTEKVHNKAPSAFDKILEREEKDSDIQALNSSWLLLSSHAPFISISELSL